MGFLDGIKLAIQESEMEGRLVTLEGVTGLSGDKLIGLLQRCTKLLCKNKDLSYLEIGVYHGLTLTSVSAVADEIQCFGVDDFSQFDPDGANKNIVKERLVKHTSGNSILINADFEDALLCLRNYIGNQKIAVYFVDGPHDYRSQYLCLDYVRPYLSDDVVIVIDDSNYEHVRRANRDWLRANPEFSLIYEAYTPCHPGNMKVADEIKAREGWWNGINVIVRDKNRCLTRMYPPVDGSRERYFNDHLIHPSRYAELVPKLLDALTARFPFNILKLIRVIYSRNKIKDRFINMNTHSCAPQMSRMAEDASQQILVPNKVE